MDVCLFDTFVLMLFLLVCDFTQGLVAIRAQGNAIKTLLMQVCMFQKQSWYDF